MDIPIPRVPAVVTPWFTKFAECFFAGVLAVNGLFMLLFLLRLPIFGMMLPGQLLLGIAAGFGFSFSWHRRERKRRISSVKLHAWLQGILRYWLAFEISTYGFGKIFKTQFSESYLRDDSVVGQLNGFELTWNYFAHSYALAVIIACLQIGGSILLLFRRTTLLGVVILLPVLFNIFLIDLYYHIPAGAFLNAILFTLGLLYLLFLRWPVLIRVFWAPVGDSPVLLPGFLRNLFRLLVIGLPFGLLFLAVRMRPVSPMAGKWIVDRLVRNRDTVKTTAWLSDPKAWTTLYIEERSTLAFCPNPYIYDPKRSEVTQYTYDSVRHEMRLVLVANRNDSARFRVSHYDGHNMQWDGIIDSDTVSLEMSRARPIAVLDDHNPQ
ncbi:MAG TPA: hypothetical protein VNU70_14165 [Puia sp.]|nr:hypothetical protein [Puia sp.]